MNECIYQGYGSLPNRLRRAGGAMRLKSHVNMQGPAFSAWAIEWVSPARDLYIGLDLRRPPTSRQACLDFAFEKELTNTAGTVSTITASAITGLTALPNHPIYFLKLNGAARNALLISMVFWRSQAADWRSSCSL